MLEHKKIQNLSDYFVELNSRREKGVYFYRINGYSEEVGEFIKKYYDTARRTGVVIEGKIPNPDEGNLAYYNEIMGMDFQMSPGFMESGLKKWLPRMNDVQRKNVTMSLYDTLDGMRKAGKTENMLKKECGNKPYLLIADGLAVKEGKTASPTIQPDYREIGRWLGERLRTKKQKIGIIADWKMSEAVQAEICGLNEALEGSESKISWCIYRRKEQDIVERMKKETKADALVVLDAGILEEFGEQAENGTYEGAELYGVGYSLKTIALLDNGNIQGLAVPDGYEIGYKSVEEITKRIEHRSYKMQGYITEYQVLGKENFSMDEDLERFLYSYE